MERDGKGTGDVIYDLIGEKTRPCKVRGGAVWEGIFGAVLGVSKKVDEGSKSARCWFGGTE